MKPLILLLFVFSSCGNRNLNERTKAATATELATRIVYDTVYTSPDSVNLLQGASDDSTVIIIGDVPDSSIIYRRKYLPRAFYAIYNNDTIFYKGDTLFFDNDTVVIAGHPVVYIINDSSLWLWRDSMHRYMDSITQSMKLK